MASITALAGGNVVSGFAAGLGAIVAAIAGCGDTTVIHGGRQPGNGAMTSITTLSGNNVASGFASGLDTVMTAFTWRRETTVVHGSG